MAEEERGPLADMRQNAGSEVRNDLGGRFVQFNSKHAGGRDVDTTDKDPDEFIKEHSPT